MFLGYLLWFILARIATPEIIGTSSAVISLTAIFTSIATLGLPAGVSRFLAKEFYEGNLYEVNTYVKAALVLLSFGILTSVTIFIIINSWVSITLDETLIIFAIILIGSTTTFALLHSIIISSLRTKVIPKVTVIASSAKFVLVIILMLMHVGVTGILMGYAVYEILASILLAFSIFRMIKHQDKSKSIIKLNDFFKRILEASVPHWIPKLITTLGGFNLGTIIVFGSNGAAEAASYFLAHAIFAAIFALVTPMFAISYPALAAMSDGRKRFTWRIMKISLIISIPLSSSVIFYSDDIVGLLGRDYMDASILLRMFLLAILPLSISHMIGQLVYAYGSYRQVLYLGIASSIPRTVLYIVLVPVLGGIGAVTSYLVGSLIGFVLSAIVAKKIGMIIHWKDLGLIVIISTIPAFTFSYLQINYILGILSTIVISVVVFVKFRILTKSDIEDVINVLPGDIAKPLIIIFTKVGRALNADY